MRVLDFLAPGTTRQRPESARLADAAGFFLRGHGRDGGGWACEKDGQGRPWEGVREAMGGAGGELLHSSNGIRIGGAFKLNDNICLFDELPLSAICINQPIISYTYV